MEPVLNVFKVFELVDKCELAKAKEMLNKFKRDWEAFKILAECRVLIEDMELEQGNEFIEDLEYKLDKKIIKENENFFKTFIEICKCLLEFYKNHLETARRIFEDLIYSNYSQEYLMHVRSVLARVCKQGLFSVSEEKEKFLGFFQMSFNVTPNSMWHIVASDWFVQWCSFVGAKQEDFSCTVPVIKNKSVKRPGPIDNSSILLKENEDEFLQDPKNPCFLFTLKPGLTEGIDFVIIPHKAFEIIGNSYGTKQDIIRYAIEQNDTIYQLEIYLKTVKIGFLSGLKFNIKKVNISRKETLGYLKKLVLYSQNIQSRIWKVDLNKLPMNRLQTLATKTFSTYLNGAVVMDDRIVIDDAEISESNLLLIEVNYKNKYVYSDDPSLLVNKCYFCQASSQVISCKQCRRKLYCTNECLSMHFEEHKKSCKTRPKRPFLGLFSCFCRQNELSDQEEASPEYLPSLHNIKPFKLVGLQNLGNTCFMNSALQCLASTKELTRFFLTNEFQSQINKSNPLGTKGKLAFEYAELLYSIQKTKEKSVAPWKLKKTISLYASQFAGHQQHDSHEFLMFLINGLHEDLNRVTKKPYYNTDVPEGEMSQMAEENWKRHLSRNQSFVVDLMHGQYRSTLKCPKCSNVSFAFDPFSCLSLPIPQLGVKKLSIKYVPGSKSSQPVYLFTFYVNGRNTVSELISKVSGFLKDKPNLVLPIEIGPFGCEEIDDSASVNELRGNNLYLFECDQEFSNYVLVKFRSDSHYSFECYHRIVGIEDGSSYEDLHRLVFNCFSNICLNSEEENDFLPYLNQGFYKLVYEANRDNNCCICYDRRCKGCEIFSNKVKIRGFYKEKSYFSVGFLIQKTNKFMLDLNLLKQSVSIKPQDLVQRGSVSIYDCFSSFSEPEILDKQNEWYCPKCRKHVQASKVLEVYKVPRILIIHLKRFRTQGFTREKLVTPVNYPVENLDISQYVISDQKPGPYELFAVSNHFGALAGGHYTASVKQDSSWFYCNDAEISETKDLSDTSSYVLFYRLKSYT